MLSEWADHVIGNRPKHAFEIISHDKRPTDNDIESFIRLYILENIPNFSIEKPIIFDAIRSYIANALCIEAIDIKLTGSAKLGFSLHPDKWLKDYQKSKSDLDFFAVSEKLFNFLQEDILRWESDKNITKDGREKLDHVIRTSIERGFISTKETYKYENSKKCKSILYRACLKLNKMANEEIIPAKKINGIDIRCYKNYNYALRQIKINIKYAIDKNIETA